MIRSSKVITASSYLSMFFLGVGTTIVGAAARNIGLSPSQIGLLISVQNVGFILAVIAAGAFSDIYEKPKILFIGSIILSIAFYTFYLKTSFLINFLIMFFIGVGNGMYEGVTDTMLLDIHKKKESLYININHFFVTFGSLMITLYLIFLQMNWRKSVTQSAILLLLLAILFAFIKIKNKKTSVGRLIERLNFLSHEKVVSILFLATICSVGLETGSVGIMTTFLMELRNFSQVTSKIGLIVFLSGIASGRLSIGFFTKDKQIFNFILVLSGLASFFFSGLYFINIEGLTYVMIFLSGITLSAIFPLILTLAGITYRDISGTVLGIIKMAIPVGGIIIPFLISIISKYFNFRISLILFPIIAFIGFFILLINREKFQSYNL